MADIKISELSNATNLNDSDLLAGVNSGSTKKFTLQRIREFFKVTFDSAYAAISHDHNRLSNGTYQIGMPSNLSHNTTVATTDNLTGAGISYDHTASGLQAENVQAAIDEINTAEGTLAGTVQAQGADIALNNAHRTNTNNPHGVTAAQAGAIPATEKAAAGGVASLGSDGHVPDAQLPTYVSAVSFTVENGTTLVLRATSSR